MFRMLFSCAALSAAILSAPTTASADGDAAAGEKVFRKCKACHVVDEEKNRVGPHLKGVVGRTPGSVEGFKYSDAMQEFGQDNVWDEATLATYLEAPKKVVKGTKMSFAGLKKEQDVADVIAYLKNEGG